MGAARGDRGRACDPGGLVALAEVVPAHACDSAFGRKREAEAIAERNGLRVSNGCGGRDGLARAVAAPGRERPALHGERVARARADRGCTACTGRRGALPVVVPTRAHDRAIHLQEDGVVDARGDPRDIRRPGRAAALAIDVVAPADDRAVGTQRDGVELATRGVDDACHAGGNRALAGGVPAPAHDRRGLERDGVVGPGGDTQDTGGARRHGALPVAVVAPAGHEARAAERDGVVATGGDIDRPAERGRDRALSVVVLAPADDRAVRAQRHRVELSGGDGNSVMHAGGDIALPVHAVTEARDGAVRPAHDAVREAAVDLHDPREGIDVRESVGAPRGDALGMREGGGDGDGGECGESDRGDGVAGVHGSPLGRQGRRRRRGFRAGVGDLSDRWEKEPRPPCGGLGVTRPMESIPLGSLVRELPQRLPIRHRCCRASRRH